LQRLAAANPGAGFNRWQEYRPSRSPATDTGANRDGFQNPEDQIVATLIEEDTAFGPENLAVPPAEIRERVQTALATVKMYDKRDRPPHLLSAGQKQRVALAGVLAMQPECVIFDESTAMLDPRGRLDVLAEMQSLHERGITVLFITHFMEEAARADRVIVLNCGDMVFDGTPRDLFADQGLLIRCGLEPPSTVLLLNEIRKLNPQLAGISSDFEQALLHMPVYNGSVVFKEQISPAPETETLISVQNLDHYYLRNTPLEHQSLFDINLEVKSGLAHGFCGATGSGKSTLLQHLNGLYRPQKGEVRIGSYRLSDPDVNIKEVRRFAGLVFQNPETQGKPGKKDDSPSSETLNLQILERRAILRALEQAQGVRSKAAQLLGITRQALDRRLEKYRIQVD